MLNAYLAEHLGEGYHGQGLTWGGSLTAAIALAEHGSPESDADGKKAIAAAMRRVGKELGNTPAVARSSYVSPAVTEQFLDGRTLEHFRDRRRRSLSARERGLDQEERALLCSSARGGSAVRRRRATQGQRPRRGAPRPLTPSSL